MYENEPKTTAPIPEQTENRPASYDREAWLQQKKAERDQAFRMAEQSAERLTKDAGFLRSYLNLQSRFPRYSVGNILLLAAQKPEAARIGDFNSWKENGVAIRRGEKGILLLEPGREYSREDGQRSMRYNAKHVFDVSQTTATPEKEPEIHRDERLLMKEMIRHAPCEVKFDNETQTPQYDGIRYDAANHTLHVSAVWKGHGYTLFPELARGLAAAHLEAGGYEGQNREFISKCVAYIICRQNHLETDSFDFTRLPESFSGLDARAVRGELNRIRDVANRMHLDPDREREKQTSPKSMDTER